MKYFHLYIWICKKITNIKHIVINSISKKRKRDSKDSLEEQILSSSAPEEGINKALRKLQSINL